MAEGQLILPGFLLPVRPAGALLEGHAVRVVGDRIDAVLPRESALREYPEDDRLELPDHVLLPGLINMHTHSPMVLMRGLADDLALDTWLREHIWPTETRWVSRDFVRQGTELALAEMVRGGVTCFNEMYFFPEEIAAAVDDAGMRAVIGCPVIDVPTPWAQGIDECLQYAERLVDRLADRPMLSPSLAPHALYTVDDDGLRRVRALAEARDLRVNMHILEAAWEIGHSLEHHGVQPLERLERLGFLDDRLVAVHMVHLEDDDIARVADRGVHVVHCPESNLKLASGICPVARLVGAGVNVCVGTDGAASNNNLDLLNELRTAALLAKGASGDPCALDAWRALDMVTINAAEALGLADRIGTIEPGKAADMAALDLAAPETQPLHHVQSQVVYAANSRQFSHVWVAGRRLLDDGVLTTVNLDLALERARDWDQKLAVRAA